MAVTRISDAVVPAVFTPYVINRTTQLSALFRSGIIVADPQIAALAKGPSNTAAMPYWNDLNGRSNVGNDDPTSKSTPQKIGANKDQTIKHFRNNSWSTMDLVASMAGSDPAAAIGSLVADWWIREQQTILGFQLAGVIAANKAQNNGDMIIDVATDNAGAPAANEKISAELLLAAGQTMGDAKGKLNAIAMHSMLHTELQRQNLIAFIPNSAADVGFGTYMGKTVIVDDSCPAVAGVNRIKYTSFLFGTGCVGYGEGSPAVPTETGRDPSAGNGTGMEVLYSRREFIMHIRGVKWTGASLAGVAPTDAELADAQNWSRVYDRKNVRLVAIVTNG